MTAARWSHTTAVALSVLMVCAACKAADPAAGTGREPGAPLDVITTIYPLEMILREIGGDRLSASSLLPPGASPHSFEPSTGDVRRVAAADLFVFVGGGLDNWATKLQNTREDADRTVEILSIAGLPLLHTGDARHGEGSDPHVWLDPILVRDHIVPSLVSELRTLDPGNSAHYARNGERLRSALSELDADIRSRLASAKGTEYIAFHSSWHYFARRYGLHERGLVEEAPGEEPTAADVARVVKAARAAGLDSILTEPQLSSRIAQAVADGFGGDTVLVDPLGSRDDKDRSTYVQLMMFNASAFATAVGTEDVR